MLRESVESILDPPVSELVLGLFDGTYSRELDYAHEHGLHPSTVTRLKQQAFAKIRTAVAISLVFPAIALGELAVADVDHGRLTQPACIVADPDSVLRIDPNAPPAREGLVAEATQWFVGTSGFLLAALVVDERGVFCRALPLAQVTNERSLLEAA